MICMLQTINKKISLKRNHVEIKPQRRSSRMTISYLSGVRNFPHTILGSTGYNDLHFVQQPWATVPSQLGLLKWHMARSSWDLQAASQRLQAGFHSASCFPFLSHFWPLWKAKSLTIDCHRNCLFAKTSLISSISATHSQSPPMLDDTRRSGKRASFQTAICRCGRSLPPLTVLPQREPLHHKRELRNHTKTNFSLLVIIQWSLHQWGSWGSESHIPKEWPGFASLEVTRVFLFIYCKRCLPGKASASQDTSGQEEAGTRWK